MCDALSSKFYVRGSMFYVLGLWRVRVFVRTCLYFII